MSSGFVLISGGVIQERSDEVAAFDLDEIAQMSEQDLRWTWQDFEGTVFGRDGRDARRAIEEAIRARTTELGVDIDEEED